MGEQCAGHIAMFETLLFSIQSLIEQGNDIEDSYNINRDKHGRFSCCHPRSHCRWPHGPKGDMNYDHGNQVQGCVWNWEAALNFTGEYKRDYPYIKLSPNFRSNIGVHHPYKDNQECLDALAMSQTDPNFQWKDFRLRV